MGRNGIVDDVRKGTIKGIAYVSEALYQYPGFRSQLNLVSHFAVVPSLRSDLSSIGWIWPYPAHIPTYFDHSGGAGKSHSDVLSVEVVFCGNVETCSNDLCDLVRQQWGHRIADLLVLGRAVSLEEIIVGESLQACGLSYRQAAALPEIGVDEIMAVLGDMRCDGRGGVVVQLDAETVGELHGFQIGGISDVLMRGKQICRKILELGGSAMHLGKGGAEQITVKVLRHMGARSMVGEYVAVDCG